MDDVTPQTAGTIYTVIVSGAIAAVAGVLKHAVTEHFKRRDRELDRMADRKREEEEAATATANDPTMALIRQLTEERALRAALEAENARLRADGRDHGKDMQTLAEARTQAEIERDEAREAAKRAEQEIESLRRRLQAPRAPAKEAYAAQPSGESRLPERRDRRDHVAGGNPQRPTGQDTVPPRGGGRRPPG